YHQRWRLGRRSRFWQTGSVGPRRRDRPLASRAQAGEALAFRPCGVLTYFRAAGKSSFRLRDLSKICPAGPFENGGRGGRIPGLAQSDGASRDGDEEFGRSAALSRWAAARGSVRSKRTTGVARAFRPESRECSPSRGGRRRIHCRPKRDSGIVGLVGSSLGEAPVPKISSARPARPRWRFHYFGGSLNRDG